MWIDSTYSCHTQNFSLAPKFIRSFVRFSDSEFQKRQKHHVDKVLQQFQLSTNSHLISQEQILRLCNTPMKSQIWLARHLIGRWSVMIITSLEISKYWREVTYFWLSFCCLCSENFRFSVSIFTLLQVSTWHVVEFK